MGTPLSPFSLLRKFVGLIFVVLQFLHQFINGLYNLYEFVYPVTAMEIREKTQRLQQSPQHLAVIVNSENPHLQDLARVVTWSVACGIPYLTVHDLEGTVKKNKLEFEKLLQQNFLFFFGIENSPEIIWELSPKSRMDKETTEDITKRICKFLKLSLPEGMTDGCEKSIEEFSGHGPNSINSNSKLIGSHKGCYKRQHIMITSAEDSLSSFVTLLKRLGVMVKVSPKSTFLGDTDYYGMIKHLLLGWWWTV
eukprot:TRINITY_DN8623_c0_g1_i12.p1 TRINITY_DN8623_c0_g1~~TRINITY_DN8623_c0_g1_i12.p1  ORF type:complete len:251 (+),score=55.34 TRINITY_DN8623_c0_g1_i12:194-946(+)